MNTLILAIISLLTVVVAFLRTRNLLNPFVLANALLSAVGFTCALNLFNPNGTMPSEVSDWTFIYMVIALCGMLVATLCLDCVEDLPLKLLEIELSPVLVFGLLAMVVGGIAATWVMNGFQIPLFAMNEIATAGSGVKRADYHVAFVYEPALGISRFLAIVAAFNMLRRDLTLGELILRQKWVLAATLISGVAFLLNGSRNAIVMNVGTIAMAMTIRQRWRLSWSLAAAGIFLLAFTAVGQFRRGGRDYAEALTFETRYQKVNTALSWVLAYSAPTYPNLDALMNSGFNSAYGLVTLSRILPSPIFQPIFGEPPLDASESMIDKDLFPYEQMTFYTIFADLYFDFGGVLSLILGVGIYAGMVYAWNRLRYQSTLRFVALNFVFSLVLFYALNRFVGMNVLLPLYLFWILKATKLLHLREEGWID